MGFYNSEGMYVFDETDNLNSDYNKKLKAQTNKNKPSWTSVPYPEWSNQQGKDFNALSFQDQRKQLRMLDSQGNRDKSMPDRMTQGLQDAYSNDNLIDMGSGVFGYKKDPDTTKETSWWEKIGKQLGGDGFLGGVKGWLDLGVRGIEAYTGLEQVGLAREQNELGRDAFSFQKAAWNKDYDARKIAYNTNARDVNAWKAAQTPGGYVMSELVV